MAKTKRGFIVLSIHEDVYDVAMAELKCENKSQLAEQLFKRAVPKLSNLPQERFQHLESQAVVAKADVSVPNLIGIGSPAFALEMAKYPAKKSEVVEMSEIDKQIAMLQAKKAEAEAKKQVAPAFPPEMIEALTAEIVKSLTAKSAKK